jgi:hypothetical protein
MTIPEPNSGCWIWDGYIGLDGYGYVMAEGRRSPGGHRAPTQAHIVSARAHSKSLPAGHEWDHLCRVRACINPDHLEAVTHRENIRRGVSIVAGYMGAKVHRCGHVKGSEHTYYRPDGRGSFCGTCSWARAGAHYREANAAKRRAEESLGTVPF